MQKIDVCFSPMMYPAYRDDDAVVVIVDVFRASTSMCTALANGASAIIPVASVEKAEAYKEQGYLVGAERNVVKCDFADFGNSPFDYTKEVVEGKDIVFTTTNGTKAIEVASNAVRVIVGAFINIGAVASYCLQTKRDVVVLCAGWNDKFCMEDTLFAGALANLLVETGEYMHASDSAFVANEMWLTHEEHLENYISISDHYERLVQNNLSDSIEYCLSTDVVSVVPELHDEDGTMILLAATE